MIERFLMFAATLAYVYATYVAGRAWYAERARARAERLRRNDGGWNSGSCT